MSVAALMATALIGLGIGLAVIIQDVAAEEEHKMLIVDSDAGADDALAILELLAAENDLQVVAVTCVTGNTGVQNVSRNVLATLHAANRQDVPVFAGAAAPLMPPAPSFSNYFGADGFGDFLSASDVVGEIQSEHAVVALVRLARESQGNLTLVCLGPLTNIALAVRLDPSFLDNFKDVYMMGGAAHGNGNARPGVEFNVLGDPEAARIVLEAASKPIYVLPWETALDAEVPMEWRVQSLGSLDSPWMQFLNLAESKVLVGSSWSSADGLLAAALVEPEVIKSRSKQRISVLVGDDPARGATLVDYSNTLGLTPNAILLEKPDASAFQRLLLRLMSRAS